MSARLPPDVPGYFETLAIAITMPRLQSPRRTKGPAGGGHHRAIALASWKKARVAIAGAQLGRRSENPWPPRRQLWECAISVSTRGAARISFLLTGRLADYAVCQDGRRSTCLHPRPRVVRHAIRISRSAQVRSISRPRSSVGWREVPMKLLTYSRSSSSACVDRVYAARFTVSAHRDIVGGAASAEPAAAWRPWDPAIAGAMLAAWSWRGGVDRDGTPAADFLR